MASDLSPENEQFLNDILQSGAFQDRREVFDEAFELLKRRLDLIRHIDEGTRQLQAGEGVVLEGEGQLRAYFDEIHAEGMKRYEASGIVHGARDVESLSGREER